MYATLPCFCHECICWRVCVCVCLAPLQCTTLRVITSCFVWFTWCLLVCPQHPTNLCFSLLHLHLYMFYVGRAHGHTKKKKNTYTAAFLLVAHIIAWQGWFNIHAGLLRLSLGSSHKNTSALLWSIANCVAIHHAAYCSGRWLITANFVVCVFMWV